MSYDDNCELLVDGGGRKGSETECFCLTEYGNYLAYNASV